MFAHAQAPVRIGIAGGGTDLPAWIYSGRVGRCLSLAIKAYTHAVAISRPDGLVVASYRKLDEAQSATEIANGLIRESALMHGWEDGFEVHTLSELSSHGSGLGVSSSIAVSLAACFRQLRSLRQSSFVRTSFHTEGGVCTSIAKDAWTVEIDRLRRPIGRQDHMAAAHGGMRIYSFAVTDAAVERSFSEDEARWVAQHLLLVRLPEGHDSRAILSGVKRPDQLSAAAAAVDVAVKAIENRSVTELGRSLLLGQSSKNCIPGASPGWLEETCLRILSVDTVHGCKVTGAGGGGHIVVACEPGSAARVQKEAALPVIEVEPDFHGVRSDGCI